jgi:hypothetical protein
MMFFMMSFGKNREIGLRATIEMMGAQLMVFNDSYQEQLTDND